MALLLTSLYLLMLFTLHTVTFSSLEDLAGNAMAILFPIMEIAWLHVHPNLISMELPALFANQERFGMVVNVFLFLNLNNLRQMFPHALQPLIGISSN